MLAWVPSSVKRRLRGHWKSLRLAVVRASCAFTGADFLQAIRNIGIGVGDTLLVHSSLDQFEAFKGKPTDVISLLQEAVGSSGTLLLPTLPYSGTAVDYANESGVFDVNKTPSKMGLLTELFRRTPGVIRSVHPTHTVAIWGAAAAELAAGHSEANTPCGAGTPYARLLERKGKILFLGCHIDSMTFFHTIEELLEPRMPFSPFTKELYILRSRDVGGHIRVTRTRLFEPRYSRKRNLEIMIPILKQRGAWKEKRVGTLHILLLEAQQVWAACEMLASQGIYCYEA
jgi:aminoglycoside 3-N-acetyltransferase